jgi:hypothetical protein
VYAGPSPRMRHSFNVASAMPNILAASAVVNWDIFLRKTPVRFVLQLQASWLPALAGTLQTCPS